MPEPSPELTELTSRIALYSSEHAYEKLYKFLYPGLHRFCFCLLKSKELAEEAANDVLINIWRNREKLIAINNIRVYAFVTARNLCLNLLNKSGRQVFVSLDDINVDIVLKTKNPEELLINEELKLKLDEATSALPTRCKLVFKLIKEDGLSYKEAATILNISVKTVDAHLVTAVKKLTTVLQLEFNLIN